MTNSVNTYERQSASEKAEVLWGQILTTQYKKFPEWSGLEIIPLIKRLLIKPIVRKYMTVTVELQSDFFPENRTKVIHTYGAVCPIKFEPVQHNFTGVFCGIEHGFIRLSLAKKPDENNMIPGAAIKFLLDGIPSVNFMAMASLEGQSSFDFFEHDFSNFVAEPKNPILKMIANAFRTVSPDPTKVDVSNLFKITKDGKQIDYPKTASQLKLVPNKDFKDFNFSKKYHEVRTDLLSIPKGSKLYDVYACDKTPILLGSIVSKDEFICSKFGDEQLFFRHERYQPSVKK